MQLLEQAEQVHEAASQAIDRPSGDHVELAAGNRLHQLTQPSTLVAALGTRDTGVLVDLDYLPAVPVGDRLQLTTLVSRGLLGRADAKIQGDTLRLAAGGVHGEP